MRQVIAVYPSVALEHGRVSRVYSVDDHYEVEYFQGKAVLQVGWYHLNALAAQRAIDWVDDGTLG